MKKTVRVNVLGRDVQEITLEGPMTVEEALAAANHHGVSAGDIRVNGTAAKLDTLLEEGDTVQSVPRIRGG